MNFRKLGLYVGIAPVVLGATLLSGCGGGGGDANDEDFVSDICGAFADFSEALEKVQSDPEKLAEAASDPDKLSALFVEPYEDLANAFADANPPSDLEDWHEEASKAMKDQVQALKDGEDVDEIFSGDPFPEAPSGPDERLSKVAENNEDCEEAGLAF